MGLLGKKEVRKLLDSAKSHSTRDALLLALMCKCGLKTSEVANLRVEDIDLSQEVIEVNNGKFVRRVPISKAMLPIIAKFIEERRKDEDFLGEETFVFSGREGPLTHRQIQKIVKKHANRSGVGREISPADLRHAFAIDFIRKTRDLHALKKTLGFKTLASVERYLGYL